MHMFNTNFLVEQGWSQLISLYRSAFEMLGLTLLCEVRTKAVLCVSRLAPYYKGWTDIHDSCVFCCHYVCHFFILALFGMGQSLICPSVEMLCQFSVRPTIWYKYACIQVIRSHSTSTKRRKTHHLFFSITLLGHHLRIGRQRFAKTIRRMR